MSFISAIKKVVLCNNFLSVVHNYLIHYRLKKKVPEVQTFEDRLEIYRTATKENKLITPSFVAVL